MENKNKIKEVFFSRLEANKTAQIPQEALTNRMMVQKGLFCRAVQPHNYRLYFDFDNRTLTVPQPCYIKNHGSEYHFDYPTHRVVVKKKTVEITYKGHQKQWRRIIADTEEKIDLELKEIDKDIHEKIFNYLKDFIAKNGGKSNFKLLRERRQDWGIHGDEFLDSIPTDMIITTDVCKKVYRDKVEFTGVNETANYLANSSLQRFSPQIADAINQLAARLDNKPRTKQDSKFYKEISIQLIKAFEGYLNWK